MRTKLTIEALDPLATNRLIGRDIALTELTEALQSDKTSVVSVIAPGGVGKTALVRTWLYSLVKTGYEKNRIQVWRFTDLAHHKNASSNLFFQTILGLDGESGKELDSVKRSGTDRTFISEDQKAKRLLEKFLAGPSIIVLDQMEVLQYHGKEEPAKHGRLYDEAIKRFLLGAAEQITGDRKLDHSGRLIIVTSREHLTDLEDDSPGYNPINLVSFEEADGAELLRSLGVVGSDRELREATLEYGGNALALILLGRLIMSIPTAHKRIAFRTLIPFFDSNNEGESGGWKQAKDILAYYVANLGGVEEKALLNMMGLFHRAMESGPRNHLLHHANLTSDVRGLTNAEWENCHNNLEKFGLLIPAFSRPRDQWDCHPLIREHFRHTLREETPELWQQAHQVLFEYFAGLPSEERPRTRQALIPLYRAIPHGCLAERYADALSVYEDRVMQGPVIAYGTNELGAIAQDSAALSMFFKPETTELLAGVIEQLNIQKQAWLQARMAFCLTCLGRLEEAIEHRKQELAHCDKQRKTILPNTYEFRELHKNTAFATAMLSELHLLVGNLAEAERVSRKAIDFADQSNDWGQSMRCRCRLATVLHMQGILSEAEKLFNEAVELQCSNQPQRPALNSDHGFMHRKFLLDQAPNLDYGYYRDLLKLSETALDYDVRDLDHHWLVAIGLGQLSKASSMGHMAEFDPNSYQLGAKSLFNEAEQLLSDSGSVIYFPELFLERARFLGLQRFAGQAIQDAKKALRYAMDYEMPLYQADAHILIAEFNLTIGQIGDARDALEEARKIIHKSGYMRRWQKLKDLEGLFPS